MIASMTLVRRWTMKLSYLPKTLRGARDMAQGLRALAALVDDLGSA